jgi:hypothetical protein
MRPSAAAKDAGAMPGPNAYERDAKTATMKKNPAFGFGTASNRPRTQGNEYIPGPGTYKSKDITGTETHGKTLLSKYETPKTSNQLTPGPGTYQARFGGHQPNSPQYKLGSSKRDDMDRVNQRACNFPPPDTYNPKFKQIKERGSSWTMGSG